MGSKKSARGISVCTEGRKKKKKKKEEEEDEKMKKKNLTNE